MPWPRRKGRWARSRSRQRQPRMVVSSVMTMASQPAALARPDQRGDQLVGTAPVELEPLGSDRAVGDLLHRVGRLVGDDHRRAHRRGAARHRQVRLGVGQGHHPDGTGQEGRRQGPAEQGHCEVAAGAVERHARDDLAGVEGGAVGVHGGLAPGPAGDIGPGLVGQLFARHTLQLGDGEGQVRHLPLQAAHVSLALAGLARSDLAHFGPLWSLMAKAGGGARNPCAFGAGLTFYPALNRIYWPTSARLIDRVTWLRFSQRLGLEGMRWTGVRTRSWRWAPRPSFWPVSGAVSWSPRRWTGAGPPIAPPSTPAAIP